MVDRSQGPDAGDSPTQEVGVLSAPVTPEPADAGVAGSAPEDREVRVTGAREQAERTARPVGRLDALGQMMTAWQGAAPVRRRATVGDRLALIAYRRALATGPA